MLTKFASGVMSAGGRGELSREVSTADGKRTIVFGYTFAANSAVVIFIYAIQFTRFTLLFALP